MGRPETDPQPYFPEQTGENQTDYVPQAQEYDYSNQQVSEVAASTTNDEITNDPLSYGTYYQNVENTTTTDNYAPPQNDPQNQQPQPVQPVQQYAPQQLQNPQMNQNSFSTQPPHYPPAQNNQNNLMRSPPNNPQAYPPQPQPMSYPPTQATNFQANYPPQPQPACYPSTQATNNQTNYANYYQANVQQPPAVVNYPPAQGGVQMGYHGQVPPSPCNPPTDGIPIKVPGPPSAGWSSGLFDCMNNPSNALITACFPCVTFGQIAEIIDNGHSSCATSGILYGVIAALIYVPCLMSCTYRTKLRSKYGLIESPAPDWIVHCVFEWCALCQEYRELEARGLDPAIGWLGNAQLMQQRQQQQMAMMAPTPQTMMG